MSPFLELSIITYHDAFVRIAELKGANPDIYQKLAAVVQLSPEDLKLLGINEGQTVELRNESGYVVVRARQDPSISPGIACMPFSLYSLQLSSYDPAKMNMPNLKRIRVVARPSNRSITTVKELQERKFG
jgi:formylmethanofuran dehydrogenase subunit D